MHSCAASFGADAEPPVPAARRQKRRKLVTNALFFNLFTQIWQIFHYINSCKGYIGSRGPPLFSHDGVQVHGEDFRHSPVIQQAAANKSCQIKCKTKVQKDPHLLFLLLFIFISCMRRMWLNSPCVCLVLNCRFKEVKRRVIILLFQIVDEVLLSSHRQQKATKLINSI